MLLLIALYVCWASVHSHFLFLPYTTIFQNKTGDFEGLCNAWHSFISTSMPTWFYNHRIDGLLMTAGSVSVISNIHHSGATRSGQDMNPWEACYSLVMMLYQPLLPLKTPANCDYNHNSGAVLKIKYLPSCRSHLLTPQHYHQTRISRFSSVFLFLTRGAMEASLK